MRRERLRLHKETGNSASTRIQHTFFFTELDSGNDDKWYPIYYGYLHCRILNLCRRVKLSQDKSDSEGNETLQHFSDWLVGDCELGEDSKYTKLSLLGSDAEIDKINLEIRPIDNDNDWQVETVRINGFYAIPGEPLMQEESVWIEFNLLRARFDFLTAQTEKDGDRKLEFGIDLHGTNAFGKTFMGNWDRHTLKVWPGDLDKERVVNLDDFSSEDLQAMNVSRHSRKSTEDFSFHMTEHTFSAPLLDAVAQDQEKNERANEDENAQHQRSDIVINQDGDSSYQKIIELEEKKVRILNWITRILIVALVMLFFGFWG
jgi:hypothetical protein